MRLESLGAIFAAAAAGLQGDEGVGSRISLFALLVSAYRRAGQIDREAGLFAVGLSQRTMRTGLGGLGGRLAAMARVPAIICSSIRSFSPTGQRGQFLPPGAFAFDDALHEIGHGCG